VRLGGENSRLLAADGNVKSLHPGTPVNLPSLPAGMMVVGFATSQGDTYNKTAPSCALVAARTAECASYSGFARALPDGEGELSTSRCLEVMVSDAIEAWTKKSADARPPDSILFFRHGLADSDKVRAPPLALSARQPRDSPLSPAAST